MSQPNAEATGRDPARIVDATPTKGLFITMLTRDIALIPSIIDLVDNCADGARRIRNGRSYEGLWARLEISRSQFRLSDNCGGISVEIARQYAFRFGRAQGAPSVKHSIGEFGVGMKRAIFKLGNHFRVESTTPSTRFVIDQDIAEWAAQPEWEYEFSECEENGSFELDQHGTSITVSELYESVAEEFDLDTFVSELKEELMSKLRAPIAAGLSITVNGLPVDAQPLRMLQSSALAPAYAQMDFSARGSKRVQVKLYCGLGVSDDRKQVRADAGWHIFCNGRLIVEGDKTSATGWGDEADKIELPVFHGQFNSLRGYAYFDSDDPGRLPWNTTKTGLNMDSPIYRAVRLEMMKMMRPVIDFLNKLKEEKQSREDEEEAGPLEALVVAAKATDVTKLKTRPAFKTPTVRSKAKDDGPIMQRIQYDRPKTQVLEVMRHLNAKSFKEVGEKTFDYYYNAEVVE